MLQNKYGTFGRNPVVGPSNVRLSGRRRKQAGHAAQPYASGAFGEKPAAGSSGIAPDLQGAASAFFEMAVQIESGTATSTSEKLGNAGPAWLPVSGGLTARR